MRIRFWLSRAAVAAIWLTALSNIFAAAVVVQEAQNTPTTTEYSILNNSQTTARPFDIALLVVSTISTNPASASTTNANWYAETLNAGGWAQTMGEATGNFNLPTWQQYTGMTYLQAFPSNPRLVNGYFLNYNYDSVGGNVSFPNNPIFPSNPLFGGFFNQGALDSTFLVEGPDDGTTNASLGQLQSYQDATVIVPEPGAFGLCLVALGCGAAFVRRSRRS